MLYLDPEDPIRLKSFTSSSKGAKATIRIELETEDMYEFGRVLESLKRVQSEQTAPKPKPKVRLALPKPEGV